MRYPALSPGGLTLATTEGIVEMRGLLSPSECEKLAPPEDIRWATEEPDDPGRSWQHTPEFRQGAEATEVSPQLQRFLLGFRDLIQTNAAMAQIPELESWGRAPFNSYPIELLGFQRSVYGAKWHRTPASHEIGWHSDDTHDQADPDVKGEFGVTALGLMVAISLSKHGGTYEYAPAGTEANQDGSPCDPTAIRKIEGISQGDAIGFCTAKNPNGGRWEGSFPLHRFVADKVGGDTEDEITSRDSLVIYFRDVSDRTLADVGIASMFNGVKNRLLQR